MHSHQGDFGIDLKTSWNETDGKSIFASQGVAILCASQHHFPFLLGLIFVTA